MHADEVHVPGDTAYAHGNFDYELNPVGEGETISGAGKFLSICVLQAEGSWKIAIDCFNDNGSPSSR